MEVSHQPQQLTRRVSTSSMDDGRRGPRSYWLHSRDRSDEDSRPALDLEETLSRSSHRFEPEIIESADQATAKYDKFENEWERLKSRKSKQQRLLQPKKHTEDCVSIPTIVVQSEKSSMSVDSVSDRANDDDDEDSVKMHDKRADNDELESKHENNEFNRMEIIMTPRSNFDMSEVMPSHLLQNSRQQHMVGDASPILEVETKISSESIKSNCKRPKRLQPKPRKKGWIGAERGSVYNEPIKIPDFNNLNKNKKKKFQGRLKNSYSKSTVTTKDSGNVFTPKRARKPKRSSSTSIANVAGPAPVDYNCTALTTTSTGAAPDRSASAFPAAQVKRRHPNNLKARESKQLRAKETFEKQQKHMAEIRQAAGLATKAKKGQRTQARRSNSNSEYETAGPTQFGRAGKDFTPLIEQILEHNYAGSDARDQDEQAISPRDFGIQDEGGAADDDDNDEKEKQQQQQEQPAQQANACTQDYNDPFETRNYQLPTKSSRLKQVERSFQHELQVRGIPFVVGTSLSRSHNIGLNVQQVLGLIKTKQPAVPGISSLLIRKVSRGMQPVSSLLEHLKSSASYCDGSAYYGQSRPEPVAFRSSSCSTSWPTGTSSFVGLEPSEPDRARRARNSMSFGEPLYEEDEDGKSIASSAPHQVKEKQLRLGGGGTLFANPKPSVVRGLETLPEPGFGLAFNASKRSDVDVMQVLMRLYREYEQMISQQEKFKEQLEVRNKDKSATKQLSDMETALVAKDQEIGAFCALYQEIASLKKQLQQRNSFVCITSSRSKSKQASSAQLDTFSNQFYNCQNFGLQQRDQTTYVRLTRFLREIQNFQRTLAMA
ncbi:uncharacterized protein LOC106660325 [Trichogramma pretiosum]|uniref:uncharacterized protein LOC106660325 n=1 Tax=Trichogramma pretiosum TaxID=7493 RepID=UPI0006C9D5F7|nr:uncharacterized protein LOC106660325 [Trichogramma pretiosum]